MPSTVSAVIGAFHEGIKPSPMLAYLVEMAVRLIELRRVLKPTGSLYLHCDPTASSSAPLLEEGRRPELPLLILPAYQRAERVRLQAAEQPAPFEPGDPYDSN